MGIASGHSNSIFVLDSVRVQAHVCARVANVAELGVTPHLIARHIHFALCQYHIVVGPMTVMVRVWIV